MPGELMLIRLRLDGDLMDGAVSSAVLDIRERAAVTLGEATRIWLSGDLLIELGSDLAEAGRGGAELPGGGILQRLHSCRVSVLVDRSAR